LRSKSATGFLVAAASARSFSVLAICACCLLTASLKLPRTLRAGVERAGEVEHGEHQEDREKIEGDGRDEAGALAIDVTAGQCAGSPD